MTLTELKYVIAVARERHFGRAAESCFVSQPSLSVAIKKLEEELGVSIFERRTPDISATRRELDWCSRKAVSPPRSPSAVRIRSPARSASA